MAEYYVIKNKETGLYFRGKGVNRWGKYFNQASIYRTKGTAEHSIKEIAWHGEQAEIVSIHIVEAPAVDAVEVVHAKWIMRGGLFRCSKCDAKALWRKMGGTGGFSCEYEQAKTKSCPGCNARMDGE